MPANTSQEITVRDRYEFSQEEKSEIIDCLTDAFTDNGVLLAWSGSGNDRAGLKECFRLQVEMHSRPDRRGLFKTVSLSDGTIVAVGMLGFNRSRDLTPTLQSQWAEFEQSRDQDTIEWAQQVFDVCEHVAETAYAKEDPHAESCNLFLLGTRRKFQGRGFGKAIVDSQLEDLRMGNARRKMTVNSTSDATTRFYTRLGARRLARVVFPDVSQWRQAIGETTSENPKDDTAMLSIETLIWDDDDKLRDGITRRLEYTWPNLNAPTRIAVDPITGCETVEQEEVRTCVVL